MGLDGCGQCMKWTMIVANVLILISGFAVMSVGIWTCVDKSSFEKLMGNDLYMNAAYILVATGVVVVIISVIGCLGALRDIKCLLLAYFIILFIIFVIMLVGGILGYVFKSEVGEKMKARMQYTITEAGYIEPGVRDTWDTLQRELKCCGTRFNDSSDSNRSWEKHNEQFKKEGSDKVPLSCCILNGANEPADRTACTQQIDKKATHTKDCYDAALVTVQEHALVLGGVGVGIACILILGMIFSLILFKTIE